MEIREIILLVSFIISIGLFIDIYIRAQKSIPESKRLEREGFLIYSDARGGEMLVYEDEDFIIRGKPDEIYELPSGELVVVDYKSTLKENVSEEYYKYQIGVYFLLIEREFNREPAYGIIEDLKTGYSVRVENTPEFREEVLNTIREIVSIYRGEEVKIERNHEDKARCEICKFRADCPFSLSV